MPRVAIVGANSSIGRFLLPRLARAGLIAHRIGREHREEDPAVTHVFDRQSARFMPPLDAIDAIISLAPLPSIESVLTMARALGVRRLIAFGSTARFSKACSTSPIERDFAVQQARAEQCLISGSESSGIAWTLFRPTMIYGADADQNVAFIQAMIRKFGFFPLPFNAKGLRQPVHADDLAAACMASLTNELTIGKAYNLGGGEILEFPDLVRRIFIGEGKKPLLIPLPLALYSALLEIARHFPQASFVRKEMGQRMFEHLLADNGPAIRDFAYAPRPFIMQPSAQPSESESL